MGRLLARVTVALGIVGAAGLLAAAAARADEKSRASDIQDLAKESQNPIASLIVVPFENNINYNAGPLNKTDDVLTAKPVYPVKLSDGLNLINRVLIPIVSQGSRSPGEGREVGLGDITYQGFLSPAASGDFTWGAGPTIVTRTGSGDLSSDQWSLGPNLVALLTPGRWVAGVLVFNVWSVVGDDQAKDISQGSLQYFLNYNFDGGWYLTSAPVITANWKAKNAQTWTVPVGGGFGRVFHFGKQPLNARLAGYYNVERPDKSSDWTLSAQLTFLFPK